jgi:elongation factor G
MSLDDFIDFDLEDLRGDLCTCSRPVSGEGRFIKQKGGDSRFAHVKLVVGPHPGIHCYRFIWRPENDSLPKSFMRAACLAGVKEALRKPLRDGRRIAFVEVAIVDGSWHEQDTDEMSLQIATYMAMQDALNKAHLVED